MNVDEAFAVLKHNDGIFPREALNLAIDESELITPDLLREVKYSIANIGKIYDDTVYMRHIYAIYLLAQFRETKAHPLIVELFSMPGDIVQHVTGDVITEDLGRILASTFDGNLASLERIIENTSVNEYVRSAAVQALVILWGREVLTRQQVINYFHSLFDGRLAEDDSIVWSSLVAHSLNLSPAELEKDIEKAFDRSRIDPFYVGRDDFNRSLGLSNEEALEKYGRDRRSNLIDDTVAEMEGWACFQPKGKRAPLLTGLGSNPSNPGLGKKQKVGRNDLCPCGSGKKYKKCCLRADQA